MRGTPWRLPYWPCDSLPMESPPSRSSLVSWSESNESATAQRAPPFQLRGRKRAAGAHTIDDAAPVRFGPLPGLAASCRSFLRACLRSGARSPAPPLASLATKLRELVRACMPTPSQAQRVELLLHVRLVQRPSHDLGVQLRHDLRRRARRQPQRRTS